MRKFREVGWDLRARLGSRVPWSRRASARAFRSLEPRRVGDGPPYRRKACRVWGGIFGMFLATSCIRLAASEHFIFYPDWFPGAQFAGLYTAMDRGYFREVGLEVEIIPFAFGQKVETLIGAHPETAAAASIEGYIFLQKRAQGIRWQTFGAVLQQAPAGYMSLRESLIAGVADFAGKTIGVHKFGDPLYHYFLRRAGVAETSAQMIFVNNDLGDLMSGRVAAMQGFATEEFILLRRQVGDRARFLSFRELGFDSYSQMLITLPDQVATHRSALKLFLVGLRRGWKEALAHPEVAVPAVHARAGKDCDDAFQHDSLLALREYIAPDGTEPLAKLIPAKLAQLERTCVQIGFLKAPEAVENYLVEVER